MKAGLTYVIDHGTGCVRFCASESYKPLAQAASFRSGCILGQYGDTHTRYIGYSLKESVVWSCFGGHLLVTELTNKKKKVKLYPCNRPWRPIGL
jgi:hypothetical protein